MCNKNIRLFILLNGLLTGLGAGVRMACWFQSGWIVYVILVTGFRCTCCWTGRAWIKHEYTAIRGSGFRRAFNKPAVYSDKTCLSCPKRVNITSVWWARRPASTFSDILIGDVGMLLLRLISLNKRVPTFYLHMRVWCRFHCAE